MSDAARPLTINDAIRLAAATLEDPNCPPIADRLATAVLGMAQLMDDLAQKLGAVSFQLRDAPPSDDESKTPDFWLYQPPTPPKNPIGLLIYYVVYEPFQGAMISVPGKTNQAVRASLVQGGRWCRIPRPLPAIRQPQPASGKKLDS